MLRYVFDMNDVWHVFVCQGNMWAGLGTIICLVGANKNMNIAKAARLKHRRLVLN